MGKNITHLGPLTIITARLLKAKEYLIYIDQSGFRNLGKT